MSRALCLTLALTVLAMVHAPANARAADAGPTVTDPALAPAVVADEVRQVPQDPVAAALYAKLDALPADGTAEEITERAALIDFYDARSFAPLWVGADAPAGKAAAIKSEFGNAADWGLAPEDFALANLPSADAQAPDAVADAEVAIAQAILKYARYARGGRISDPTVLLNSNLDRKPQLLEPQAVLEGIATSDAPDAYLRGLHPQHPQFEKLRKAMLATRNPTKARQLAANMEHWRWMPDDLGELHILANVPEFMVYLVKDGEPIHAERIVVGELDKQTTIFTRNLKTIVFKPMWRVPESIKVRELLPDLRRNASMFRQHGLQLETKDGTPLDYRSIDWRTADIREYEVVQPPGPKNVMGVVKFTFPSQHTIFMHDTIDKWMFAKARRTLSHGCLRLRKPMRMAELVLEEDKGWDGARVRQAMADGPRNNEIVIDRKIPVHLVYFTAWVNDKGQVRYFSDVYGHERRIRQALAGRWDDIDVGRDHLAPVVPTAARATAPTARAARSQRRKGRTIVDIVGNALGGGL